VRQDSVDLRMNMRDRDREGEDRADSRNDRLKNLRQDSRICDKTQESATRLMK
jgi:hypothetical protein